MKEKGIEIKEKGNRMKLEALNINQHDLQKVSELIYETELELFRSLLGKDKNEAISNIEKLIKSGDNSFGYKHIHVVTDEDNELLGKGDNLLGILVSFSGKEISLWADFKAYSRVLNFSEFLKYLIKGTAINELLTATLGPYDYYLSNIAVDSAFRGQGIGSYILKNALKLAEDAECPRVILDVTFDNESALRLYERFGFKIYGSKSAEWIFKGQGTFNMEFYI